MPNDQYQIPEQYNESEIRAQISAIQTVNIQEQAPTPARYQAIKDIESEIYSLREKALNSKAKSQNWLRGIVITPQAPTLNELIDRESIQGGKIFGEIGARFWLDEKQHHHFHGAGDEWYFQQPNPADSKNPIVLRFQTSFDSVYKLYNGIEQPVTQEDIKHLTDAAIAYKEAIAPLYVDTDTV